MRLLRTPRHGAQRGFTLIELLIVVAIIGIIAAILIPNLIDALQKAKQKRSVADIRNTGAAMMSWLTDQVSAAAAGQSQAAQTFYWPSVVAKDYAFVQGLLRPSNTFYYMSEVPEKDGWKNDYQFIVDLELNNLMDTWGNVGLRSSGRDTAVSTSYISGPFIATDYDQDIVWADGYFVRWPGGVEN